MTLVQAWIDSIQLLRPKNFKLFVLVTLKSIVEAYKLFFKYFWWIVPVFIAVALLFSLIGPFTIPNYYGPIEALVDRNVDWFYLQMPGVVYVLYSLLFLAVCFITRPSIDKKDCKYLRTQYKRIILYSLIMMALGISSLSAWHVFVVLFFLDSRGGPKNFLLSVWYALKMIIFNYPLLAVIGIILHLPLWLINMIYIYQYDYAFVFPIVVSNLIGILLLPIGICTYANIYIKKLHDQFDLYVKQPQ